MRGSEAEVDRAALATKVRRSGAEQVPPETTLKVKIPERLESTPRSRKAFLMNEGSASPFAWGWSFRQARPTRPLRMPFGLSARKVAKPT